MNEEYWLLGNNAVQMGKSSLAFRKNVLPSPEELAKQGVGNNKLCFVPPKRRQTSSGLHMASNAQSIVFFTVTTVEASNPIRQRLDS